MALTGELPHLNAALNATSAVLLCVGRARIRAGDREGHRRCMLGAFAVSVLFLVSYLVYHALHGSTRFQGQGWIRTAYFTLLLTHTVLAALVPFLAGISLWRALRGDFVLHRRIAVYAWPVWMYVSVTGVMVYLMLYQLYPRG